MKHFYLILFFSIILLSGCGERQYSNPGPSLIYLSFDGDISNKGVLPVEFSGDKYVSFTKGVSDSCLNLSEDALYRKPILINKGPKNSFSDYEGISVLLWVKTEAHDPHNYVIVGQKKRLENGAYIGWHISKTPTGGWIWEFSDGENTLSYNPPHKHQPIDDGQWHQIGFTMHKGLHEASFYYDGNLKSVFSFERINMDFPGTSIFAGSSPLTDDPRRETFNGSIDELGIWSRALSHQQVAGYYNKTGNKKLPPLPSVNDSITVMTWNIWNGGTSQGKYVGVKRVADIIKNSGADIVAIQETMGSGETIAGELDFFYYRRSHNLSILSRFAPVRSYNAFRPDHFGALQLDMGENKNIIVGPVWLSRYPNLSAYFLKEDARADTIEVREMETRGRETNFLLSEIRPFILNSEQIPVLLAGDFNSGSHLDWTERNKENHNNLVVNFPTSRFMENAGFHDAYREIFPNEVKNPGHTWSPVYQEGLKTRMDFIYYQGSSLVPSTAKVINVHPDGFPSDHGAVVVSFKID